MSLKNQNMGYERGNLIVRHTLIYDYRFLLMVSYMATS